MGQGARFRIQPGVAVVYPPIRLRSQLPMEHDTRVLGESRTEITKSKVEEEKWKT